MDVVVWLRSLGLERYEAAFHENEISEQVLRPVQASVGLAAKAYSSRFATPSAASTSVNLTRRS
jgi:hypothetical protein